MAAEDVGKEVKAKVACVCPYCEQAMDASAPWCQVCQVEVRFCTVCGEPLPQGATECPSCGGVCEE
jgi:hypothetical protein